MGETLLIALMMFSFIFMGCWLDERQRRKKRNAQSVTAKSEPVEEEEYATPVQSFPDATPVVGDTDEDDDDEAFMTDKYEVTGYKILSRFMLSGACYQSEQGKALSRSLHAGDPVQLVPEPYNIKDMYAIAVHVKGERIGYVQANIASRIVGSIFDGYDTHYATCQVIYTELNPGYDTPKMMLAVFVEDETGTDRLLSDRIEPDYIYIEPTKGCGVDMMDDILHRGYLMVSQAKQIIYTHPEWYERITSADPEEMKAEDDEYFSDFVCRLYSGGIVYDSDVQDFIKDLRDERTHGTSRILSRRIKQYLTLRGVWLLS